MALGPLETERLLIRPLVSGDLDRLHQLLDADLQWGGPGVTLEQRRERMALQSMLARWEDTGCLYGDRAIVLKATGEIIGICGFRPWMCTPAERALFNLFATDHSFNTPELGVGYALSSAHRGQGYATEAVKALLRYAFDEIKVRRVVALTFRGNHASVAVMRRAGMDVGMNPDPAAVYPWAVGRIENH